MQSSLFRIVLMVSWCVTSLIGFGQTTGLSSRSSKAIKLYQESENYYVRRQYPQAIELLIQAIKKDDVFIEAHSRIASCYKQIQNLEEAAFHYGRAVELLGNDRKAQIPLIALAEVNFYLEKYVLSVNNLNRFFDSGGTNPNLEGKAKNLLANAEFAAEKIKSPLEFNPSPLPDQVNRFALQYFPVLTADQESLFFTRRAGVTPEFDEDIYVSQKTDSGTWSRPRSLSSRINSPNNEGTCTISADGKMLIFTSCVGRNVLGSCDLFVSYKSGEVWTYPENMGSIINTTAWESQPSLSADGRTLYFVSNRGGGFGKLDIWVTRMGDSNHWTSPVNLGPSINTAADDVSPFIHVNGQTLFFASEGYRGFGGFDLYSSEIGEKGWTDPTNLGYPLNNSDDQVSLFITADGQFGYYSYESRSALDFQNSTIHEFAVPDEIKPHHRSNFVTGTVFDAETRKVLSAKVELIDINRNRLISSVHSDPVNGGYLIVLTEGAEYALYASRVGYLFESLSFNYVETTSLEPVYIDIYLKKAQVGSGVTLNNIFFDFDQYVIRKKSETELNRVLQFLGDNPKIHIKVEGHTDDKGSEEYNNSLSLNRAKAVYDYLLDQGASPDVLDYEGFGQAAPLVPNDSEANRQRNRRIEFRITERTNPQ